MSFPWKRWVRRLHYWGSLLIALPVVAVIGSGLLLQWKKQVAWIQPPTQRGAEATPTIGWEEILQAAASEPKAGIQGWGDIDRLDFRPEKGLVKVRAKNRWEVQVDTSTGEVLQAVHRRSDLIESIHDGSFFHPHVKLWVFFPVGVILLGLWTTGIVLILLPYLPKRRTRV